MLAIDMIYF